MFRFSQPATPAIQDFMNAQFTLYTDISERAFHGMQKIGELNIQVAQSMMEDSLKSAQQLLTTRDPYEAASIAAAQAQPAAEKWRSYQQGLTNIAASTQADIAKVAESHVPTASRTASAVADEVARTAKDQTEQAVGRQKAALDKSAQGGAAGMKAASAIVQP